MLEKYQNNIQGEEIEVINMHTVYKTESKTVKQEKCIQFQMNGTFLMGQLSQMS